MDDHIERWRISQVPPQFDIHFIPKGYRTTYMKIVVGRCNFDFLRILITRIHIGGRFHEKNKKESRQLKRLPEDDEIHQDLPVEPLVDDD